MAHQPLIIHVIQQHGQWIGNCEQKAVDRDAILPGQTFPERKKIANHLFPVHVQVLFVDGSFVDGVRRGMVDQFTGQTQCVKRRCRE